jgi:hypothetical protein
MRRDGRLEAVWRDLLRPLSRASSKPEPLVIRELALECAESGHDRLEDRHLAPFGRERRRKRRRDDRLPDLGVGSGDE